MNLNRKQEITVFSFTISCSIYYVSDLLVGGIPGLWDMLPFFLMSFSTALDLTMGLTRWRL